MNKEITLLTSRGCPESDYLHAALSDFWQDVRELGLPNVTLTLQSRPKLLLQKLFYKAIESTKLMRLPRLRRNNRGLVFSAFLGPDFSQFLYYHFAGYEISFYMMDAWPCYHPRIEKALRLFDIRHAAFSAKQVAEKFQKSEKLSSSSWIAEAIRPAVYYSRAYAQRDIDVLNFGRKWDLHHDKICEPLNKLGITYLYEKVKGEMILPTRSSFLDAISRSKIAICVPSSITHPGRSADVETLTWRYLQCMAAKCLIVGVAPKELIELFGYNPVIEIDIENPVEQIVKVLEQYHRFDAKIEQNYSMALQQTWGNRFKQIYDRISCCRA